MRALVLAAAVLLGGCSRCKSSDNYWTRMCVSADETRMLAGGDHLHVVNLTDGHDLSTRKMYTSDVLCQPDGSLIAISLGEAVWVDGGQRLPHDTTERAAATLADGRLVYSVHPMESSRSTIRHHAIHQYLEVAEPGHREAGIRYQVRAPIFGSAPDSLDFHVQVVGARADRRIQLAAPIGGDRWQFFGFDIVTKDLSPIGPARPGEPAWYGPLSADGSVAAGWRRLGAQAFATAIGTTDDAPRFDVRLDGMREVTALAIRADGDALAVAGPSADGSRSHTVVIDGRTGRLLWKTEPVRANTYLVHFLRDGSLIVASSNLSVARHAGDSGAIIWRRRRL